VFIGGVFANSFFLFVRGFIKDKIDISIENMQLDHKSDYLEGRLILMSIVITFITPVLYLSFIKRKADENVELHGLTDPTVDIVAWQLPCVWFQAVSVFLLVFVSFRFSPWPNNKSLNKVWMFVIPKLQLLCVIFTFVLIPIFLICKSFSNFDAIQSSPYKAALWLQCMLSIYLLPWIFMQIAGLVRAAIGRYQMDKKLASIRGSCATWYYLKEQKPDEIEDLIKEEIKNVKEAKEEKKFAADKEKAWSKPLWKRQW